MSTECNGALVQTNKKQYILGNMRFGFWNAALTEKSLVLQMRFELGRCHVMVQNPQNLCWDSDSQPSTATTRATAMANMILKRIRPCWREYVQEIQACVDIEPG